MSKWVTATDKAAIGLSMVCLLHCLALPLALIVLPSLSGLFVLKDEVFHIWLLYAVIPISVFAVTAGYLHHRKASVFLLSCAGMLLLIFAALYGHDYFGHTAEVWLTVVGSILIAFGHFKNLRLRRDRRTKHEIQQLS